LTTMHSSGNSVMSGGAASLAQGKPSLSVYLGRSATAPKKAKQGSHRIVQTILRDLDKIKRGRSQRRLQKCERLIHFIVQQLRASLRRSSGYNDDDDDEEGDEEKAPGLTLAEHDHLLETTTIWALIHMFRMDPEYLKEVMVGAGVPSILFEIMSAHSLTGATRSYASELCFFLCSDTPLPQVQSNVNRLGPLTGGLLPDVHHGDKLSVGGDDNMSYAASELSSLADDKGLSPFVPYRINDENLAKLDALFDNMSEDGYGDVGKQKPSTAGGAGISKSKSTKSGSRRPRTTEFRSSSSAAEEMSMSMFSSRHGFGKTDFLHELDDQSISSSISSGSGSVNSPAAGQAYSIGNRFSGLVESQSLRTIRPWQSQSTAEFTLAGTVARAGPSTSILAADDFSLASSSSQQSQPQKRLLFHMRATPEIQPQPKKNGKPPKSTVKGFLDKIISQSNSHFALDARLRSSTRSLAHSLSATTAEEEDKQRQQQLEYDDDEAADEFDQDQGRGLRLALGRTLEQPSGVYSPSSSTAALSLSPKKCTYPYAHHVLEGGGGGSVRQNLRLASLDRAVDMPPANRLVAQHRQDLSLPRSGNSLASSTRSRLSVNSAVEPSDVPSFLATLDPLSLNVTRGLHAHILDAPSSSTVHFSDQQKRPARKLALETNDDDESVYSRDDDDDDEEEDDADAGRHDYYYPGNEEDEEEARENMYKDTSARFYNTTLGSIEQKKLIKKKKKMRIRAEKLVDHSFIRQLFVKKATLEDTQNLVRRMQDVLELVDSDRSGYVSWEYFARVLLAVAPQHLLRADVVAFMDAQNDNPENMIDYREFIISGKCIVVQRQNGRAVLPINGWLERQRLYTGDATTYTWKNHVKWYNKRQSEAVIWLMRRANRAFAKSDLYIATRKALRLIGQQAVAYQFLVGLSEQAAQANRERERSKRFILARALHARQRKNKVAEAALYLVTLARRVLDLEAIKEAAQERLRAAEVFKERPVQVGVARVYYILHRNISAAKWLKECGDRSVRHVERKARDLAWLIKTAETVMSQLLFRENAQDWLLRAAERYHAYCMVQDTTLLGLLRIGGKAFAYLDRQISANAWLKQRGAASVVHTNRQEATLRALCVRGQRTLRFLNAREEAYAHCIQRRVNADKLIAAQEQSIIFFRTIVAKVRNTEGAIEKAHQHLVYLGKRAVAYVSRRDAAQRRLTHIAGRAHVVRKRVLNTFVDLHQIGQFARVSNFNRYWMGITDNRVRVREESLRLTQFDAKVNKSRAGMTKHERWSAELHDAFTTLATNMLLPGESVNDKRSAAVLAERTPQITRLGFFRLLNYGQLGGMKLSEKEMEQAWLRIDMNNSGLCTFDDLWHHWFEDEAERYDLLLSQGGSSSSSSPGGLVFTLASIFSPLERVLFIFKKRFALNETKIARRVAAGGGDDDEDEDEDEDGEGVDGDDDEEEDEDEEVGQEAEQEEDAADANKTPQEKEYDRLFRKLMSGSGVLGGDGDDKDGDDEGRKQDQDWRMERNNHEQSFDDVVLQRSEEREERLEQERLEQERRNAAAMAKARKQELELLNSAFGLEEDEEVAED